MMDNVQTDAAPFQDDSGRFECNSRFPDYESFQTRLKTFRNTTWDATASRRLAEAGYFYPDKPATIQCFYCGVRVAGVTPGDNPWQIHEECYIANGCYYFKHMRDPSGTPTCFDRGDGEYDWVPCDKRDSCRLCVWEFLIITVE